MSAICGSGSWTGPHNTMNMNSAIDVLFKGVEGNHKLVWDLHEAIESWLEDMKTMVNYQRDKVLEMDQRLITAEKSIQDQ